MKYFFLYLKAAESQENEMVKSKEDNHDLLRSSHASQCQSNLRTTFLMARSCTRHAHAHAHIHDFTEAETQSTCCLWDTLLPEPLSPLPVRRLEAGPAQPRVLSQPLYSRAHSCTRAQCLVFRSQFS